MTTKTVAPGLCRFDLDEKKVHGFMVRIMRRGKMHQQFFSDKRFGGKRKSKAAAMTRLEELKEELRKHVAKEIGPMAKPDDIRFTDMLPKTRSGKIMRRLLRDIASGSQTIGDTTTLEDFSVLAKLREDEE